MCTCVWALRRRGGGSRVSRLGRACFSCPPSQLWRVYSRRVWWRFGWTLHGPPRIRCHLSQDGWSGGSRARCFFWAPQKFPFREKNTLSVLVPQKPLANDSFEFLQYSCYSDKCHFFKDTDHSIWKCPRFFEFLAYREEADLSTIFLVLQLSPGHSVANYQTSSCCRKCQGKHHILLHFEQSEL